MVQKQSQTDGQEAVFHVRARIRKDLENLLLGLGLKHEILEWPAADYHYRFIARYGDMLEIMCFLCEELDYGNFKSMISETPDQRPKLPAYHEIWHSMARLQV